MSFTRRSITFGAPAALALAGLGLPLRTAAHGDSHAARPRTSTPPQQKPWGIAGQAAAVRRTVAVKMLDSMRFEPASLQVALGETVRFRVANTGRVMHEFVIGTEEENRHHAELMLKFPDMEHDEPWMAHVPPGRTGELVWHFNRAGRFEFACLIAGHYQAGMAGPITVAAAPAVAGGLVDGEVRKVDAATGRITIRHGEIPHLDMPPMTMVFRTADASLLQQVKPGDRIRFRAEKVDGGYAVTLIEAAP